jgi:hypothetical protein
MATKKIIIGYAANELESFYLSRSCSDYNFCCLVASRGSDEVWVEKFLDKAKVGHYDLKPGISVENSEYDEIFSNSNIADIIKKNSIKKLWLTTNIDNGKFLEKWSKKEKITLLCPPFNWQKKLENKVWFDRFLTKHGLPKPESQILPKAKRDIVYNGKIVIQEALSSGGEGTFFVRNRKELLGFYQKTYRKEKSYLARKFVDGISLGITVLVSPPEIYLSPVRVQCYQKTVVGEAKLFQGLQWLPNTSISLKQQKMINQTFWSVGKKLNTAGYQGIVNFDFILSPDQVFLIECNPRLSSATPQVFQHPELLGLKDSSGLVDYYLTPKKKTSIKRCHPLRKNFFSGSYVSLKAPFSGKLKKNMVSGIYVMLKNKIHYLQADIFGNKFSTNRFICHSSALVGEKYKKNDEYGRIYSDFPLFSAQGKINADGRKVINYFNKLCW